MQGPLRPDLTILLDAPPEATLLRRARRGGSDRFEREQVAFFQRVRAAYLDRAAAEPERIRVVDASQPLEAVQAALRQILDELERNIS